MNSYKVEVDVFYYVEENELVLSSPQLGVSCVADFSTILNPSPTDVMQAFEHRLKERIARFDSPKDYIAYLVYNNTIKIKGNTLVGYSLEEYKQDNSLFDMITKAPNVQHITFTYAYNY